MNRSTLMAIEDHLRAALKIAEHAKISFLIYLINMVILEVHDRANRKIT